MLLLRGLQFGKIGLLVLNFYGKMDRSTLGSSAVQCPYLYRVRPGSPQLQSVFADAVQAPKLKCKSASCACLCESLELVKFISQCGLSKQRMQSRQTRGHTGMRDEASQCK